MYSLICVKIIIKTSNFCLNGPSQNMCLTQNQRWRIQSKISLRLPKRIGLSQYRTSLVNKNQAWDQDLIWEKRRVPRQSRKFTVSSLLGLAKRNQPKWPRPECQSQKPQEKFKSLWKAWIGQTCRNSLYWVRSKLQKIQPTLPWHVIFY